MSIKLEGMGAFDRLTSLSENHTLLQHVYQFKDKGRQRQVEEGSPNQAPGKVYMAWHMAHE